MGVVERFDGWKSPDPGGAEAISSGDLDAFQSFFEFYFPRVYGYCARRCVSRAMAEAATERILSEVLRRLPQDASRLPVAVLVLSVARGELAVASGSSEEPGRSR